MWNLFPYKILMRMFHMRIERHKCYHQMKRNQQRKDLQLLYPYQMDKNNQQCNQLAVC